MAPDPKWRSDRIDLRWRQAVRPTTIRLSWRIHFTDMISPVKNVGISIWNRLSDLFPVLEWTHLDKASIHILFLVPRAVTVASVIHRLWHPFNGCIMIYTVAIYLSPIDYYCIYFNGAWSMESTTFLAVDGSAKRRQFWTPLGQWKPIKIYSVCIRSFLSLHENHDVNRSEEASPRDPIILWTQLGVIDVL